MLPQQQIQTLIQQGWLFHQQGQFQEAEKIYLQVLRLQPKNFDANQLLGTLSAQTKQFDKALKYLSKALQIKPDFVEGYNNKANVLKELRRLDEAIMSYKKAIQLNPQFAVAFFNLGNAYRELKKNDLAISHFQKAIAIQPNYVDALNNLGLLFVELRRFEDGIAQYARALQIKPDFVECLNNYGRALIFLEQYNHAIKIFEQAIEMKGNYGEAYNNMGVAFEFLQKFPEALACYEKAIEYLPEYGVAYVNQAKSLLELKFLDEALQAYEKASLYNPEINYLFGHLQAIKMQMCLWDGLDENTQIICRGVMNHEKINLPFPMLRLTDDLALQKKCAEINAKDLYPENSKLGPISQRSRKEKIRIGYYSADFHQHATAILMAEFFELHDKNKFEIIAFSFGPKIEDDMRVRLRKSFDQFIEVNDLTNEDVAKLSRELQIDIAVDLKGYTKNLRTGIFAYRAAPIQVNYLGYPGTMGSSYIDYIIADQTLIPPEHYAGYSEKIMALPNSYQPNDRQRKISEELVTKKDCGLPDDGFIFCCFNNNYKITPKRFNSWMYLLKQVPGSVLWVFEDNAFASANLIKEAEAKGISADRIIFAKFTNPSKHLARIRLADLFLDTSFYNAHTTASDALWVGLPILTCCGNSFASRVAASLLNAIEVPELITHSEEEYTQVALELATNPKKLLEIRNKIIQNKLSTPLFNTHLFTQHMEQGYVEMMNRYDQGLAPDHIIL
jgi:predicted O-linked N-acetylglucosamine transferase (SPINDLY family)